ncbi:120_t:CDS:10 [Scutellospora calospora]|uniref:120_t:CDS:1 n=1 Tax=Scutellospora calospora TaxID=85575 RepID=A0ACA9K3T3_9GLOM|nr:120_t:CDS:10 [Scutellospora calospora]
MTEEIEVQSFEEEEIEFFEFKQLNKNALSIQLEKDTVYPEVIPPYPSLLAISNIYGFFVTATAKGFIYASTQTLRELFKNSTSGSKELLSKKLLFEIPEGRVRCLRLSSDQLTLVVGVEGGHVLFYDVTKFASEQAESRPFQIMSFSDDIRDIRPNPGEKYNLIAILLVTGVVYIKDYLVNNEVSKIEGNKVGEQFTARQLMQFTPEGTLKATFQPPPDLQQQSHYVQNVLWLETALFVVVYFPVIQEEDSEHDVYVVSREMKSKTLYLRCPIMCSQADRPRIPYFYMETIKDWGTNLKCLIICASANSADINLIARDASNNWTSLILTETSRAALPLSEIYDHDTLPVGLALDFTCTEPWNTRLTEENILVPPVPVLYILNDECDIVAYRCFHKDAFLAHENFPGMTPPKMLPTTGHSLGMLPPRRNPKDVTTFTATNITTSPVASPVKIASPIIAPIKTASPIIAPIKTASPLIAPIKTASPVVAPIKTASPITAPIKTATYNNGLSPSINYDKNFQSPNKITLTQDSTPSRNLGSSQQLTPTEADNKTPHMIRLNAIKNDLNVLHNLIEYVENDCIAKYHERTTEQDFDNPEVWSVGDLPVIMSEINRLEHEAGSMVQSLVDLRRQVNEFSHGVHIDFVKTTKDLDHMSCTPSNVITVGRRGILQSRIKERLETTFKSVKESAQALETQLNALHEQIQEKKSNKLLRQSPLEYIDKSIRNISKGLYRNSSQIERLSAQLDQLTLQISSEGDTSNSETFISHQINKIEPTKASTKNISYSIDAAKTTAAYLNKERICEKLKNVNKFKRKSPVKTTLFEENEAEVIERKSMPSSIISPKKSPNTFKNRVFPQTQIREGKSYRSRTTITSLSEPSSDYQPKVMYDTPIRENTYTNKSLPEASGILSPIELESPLAYKDQSEDFIQHKFEKIVESDDSSLAWMSPSFKHRPTPTFLSQSNDTVQEPSVFEMPSSYQKDEDAQYLDSYNEDSQDSIELNFGKFISSDVSRSSKVPELGQSYNHFGEDSKSETIQTIPSGEYAITEINEGKETSDAEQNNASNVTNVVSKTEAEEIEHKSQEISDQVEVVENPTDVIAETGNELMGVSENFGSFGLGEQSETYNESNSQGGFGLFGDKSLTSAPTSTPAFGKQTQFGMATSNNIVFGTGLSLGGNASGIPPAFATQPSNVNAFNPLPAHPSPAFGQPAFGQTAFGQSSLGMPKAQAFGQPAFGQHGFGQPRTFGTPSALTANVKPPSGSGFARFASNNAILGAGNNNLDETNASISTTKSSFMEFRG